jgi:hypothetical protein
MSIGRLELPPSFYSDEEIEQYTIQLLCGCVEGPTSVVMLYKDGHATNKVVILPGVGMDIVKAVEKYWPVVGMVLGTIDSSVDSVYDVLSRWKYTPKFKEYGVDSIYRWEPWMKELLV